MGCTSCVAIYQAPQDAYDLFDKVIVLYKGRQIFFGKTTRARQYFEELGFICPDQQTTADFLTSMTSPHERVIRPGWEGKTPRTAEEFADAWKRSRDRELLLEEIEDYNIRHPFHGEHLDRFVESRRMEQSKTQRSKSPFTLSYVEQIRLTMWRGVALLKTDPSLVITMLITNLLQAVIVSSIFYNLSNTTESFQRRAILMFFLVLMNAFGSILEIISLYAKRNIVEKHARYALYHPSAEAFSSIILDLPYKIINSILTNLIMYFMGNLRREPGAFFAFLLFVFATTLTMSMLFRLIGSITKSIAQAMAPSSVVLLGLTLYTGFVIPTAYMRDWIRWCRRANPLFYGLESIMLNEFVGRDFECASYIPSGPGYENSSNRACNVQGSVPGQNLVSGGAFLKIAYGYEASHKWRNLGIMIVFMLVYLTIHLIATEYVASARSKGEVLVFIRKAMKKIRKGAKDLESGGTSQSHQEFRGGQTTIEGVEKQTSIFHWKDVCYDIQIKGEPRRILDHVDGWVKPGTLTALMGSSGAGKTTLLDVLASRVTMGVVTGDMLVDGRLRDESFQRKTGYVQQQDLHLHTSTVREALTFSALLRQPSQYSRQEKIDYVDTVIKILNMEEYADAIIGVPGEGLNVEQRKRLTIGVELAARPQLLLFFDEPTSGLDSQTSWSICDLMETLTKNGQAILCTIHQPSAMLFQRFDRLLLLSKGKTIYFGDIGKNSNVLIDYFTRNGANKFPEGSNPAEYMLEVIGAAPGATTEIDWPEVWRTSPEHHQVQQELDGLANSGAAPQQSSQDPSSYNEFAAPWYDQHVQVTKRVFEQYWRSPGYIYSKLLLSIGTSLFIGLSFLNGDNTQRGLSNQMFGVFIFLSVFPQLVNQIMPVFVSQRTMYEARERPSKAYSWKAFMVANIAVELAWNSLLSIFAYVCWYYPIGLYKNAEWTDSVHSRGITMFLHLWIFFMFSSTFANLMIAGIGSADVAGGVMNLLLIMMFTFCGVLAGPDALPGFWIFMYRVNPFTYIIEGFLGTSLGDAPMSCASDEYVRFSAPNGTTCGEYASDYIDRVGGYLADKDATDCRYCAMSETNAFLASVNVSIDHRWRDYGFMWVYCIFNIGASMAIYWLARVPKKSKVKKE
ncbi:hypothetical protein NM208_g5663 [Fusarium decemcellulare]|uniref:Uncharacterized protein n=1 Tax=Fusarium decemcellulare TaxID=57161 RepID=A0ACC1SG40_9HYPO|nr:hypothetical protein NM208_g5663 [Fusarium decemcellulare]